jgi:hypothetical protein
MEVCKEEKVVADHVFPVSGVGICLPRMSHYDPTLSAITTISIISKKILH